jgi:hypothetical protein
MTRGHPPGVVGVPCDSWAYVEALLSINNLTLPSGSCLQYERGGTFPDAKRNRLIQLLLQQPELQWIFFCDSDHVVPRDLVTKLLDTGCDVVGGLYPSRHGSFALECGPIPEDSPVLTQLGLAALPPVEGGHVTADGSKLVLTQGAQRVIEVGWTGGGALLVRRHVLEQVPGPSWFAAGPGGDNEDIVFAARVRAAGFRIHVHLDARCDHLCLGRRRVPDSAVPAPSSREPALQG